MKDEENPSSGEAGSEESSQDERSTWDTSLETRLETSVPEERIAAPDIVALIETVLPRDGERLEYKHFLAKGGMGQVDVVLDVGLKRRLAKKIIGRDLSRMTHAVRLFLREAQITAQLDHPSIVPVHEVGLDRQGRLYFTMKLVEGKTFEEWIGESESEDESDQLHDLLEIVIKLCDALSFSHDRGVFHGDIKPPNVMVGEYGEVYLMDWGLARVREGALTRTSDVLSDQEAETGGGTPAFMAPEQARSEPIDERTDVFGLGALLYFALAGKAPYRGESLENTLLKARRAELEPPLDEQSLNVPRELARIVSKAMARERDDRYQTVSDLGSELRIFLRGGAEFPRRKVRAGEHIIRQGETGDEVFILISGQARVYQEIDGETFERGSMGPGEVFGEMAILVSSPRTASVIASEDCVLRIVTGEILERELHGMKPWMGALIRTLAQRLRRREEDSGD